MGNLSITKKAARTRAEAEAKCDAWNEKNRVGAKVTIKMDSGENRETTTRTSAYVADSGDAVIFLQGVSCYYLLERVTALPEAKGSPKQ